MAIRAVGPANGLSWLIRALNPGSTGLRVILGAGALFLCCLLGVAVVLGSLSSSWGDAGSGRFGAQLLTGALVMAVLGGLMAGFLRLLHALEQGRPARAFDLFSTYRDGAVALRAAVFIGLLALAQNALVGWVLATMAPGFMEWYAQLATLSAEGGPTPQSLPQPPPGLGAAFALVTVAGLVGFAVQAIGLGQIAFHDRGVLQALGDGVRGTVLNLLPLLVLMLAAMVAGFALVMVLAMAVLLVGAVASLAGPQAAGLAAAPLYFLFLLGAYVVMFRAMYHLWRDICGEAPGAQAPPGQVAL